MSIKSLTSSIKQTVEKRIKNEARAMHGIIRNGTFICGGKSYNYITAVDADTSNGKKVWAQKSQNNSAVIIGE